MKITLPLPPNMANSRMHWRVKNKQRKAYFESCGYARMGAWDEAIARNEGLESWRAPRKVKVKATIFCGGQMDHDNAISRLKWPIDWLVCTGFLRGDKPSQLEWHWPIEQVVKRNQQYRVEFELEPA